MSARYLVIGGSGFVGRAVVSALHERGVEVTVLDRKTYASQVPARADVVINCNGNGLRFKANADPAWDFNASVLSVERSLFDIAAETYVFVSTVDVYPHRGDPARNHEDVTIDPTALDVYGFHKWLAERLVERHAKRSLIVRSGTVVGTSMTKGPLFDLVAGQPLRMSRESRLSLIEDVALAQAILTLVEQGKGGIFNVSGAGSARLGDFLDELGREPQWAPGAEHVVHRYDLATQRIAGVLQLPTALEAGKNVLRSLLPRAP